MSELKLAPCPFCGSENIADDGGVIYCDDCCAVGSHPMNEVCSSQKLIDMWNHRPTEARLESELVEVCEMVVKDGDCCRESVDFCICGAPSNDHLEYDCTENDCSYERAKATLTRLRGE